MREIIAKILAARGYYTGFIGKWHLEGEARLPGFVAPGARREEIRILGGEYLQPRLFSSTVFPR